MIDLALDETTCDLNVENFDLTLVSDLDMVVQRLRIALLTFLGEWFLDIRQGVPYIQQMFEKGVSPGTIEGIIRQQILLVEGVRRITSLTLDFSNVTRELTITFEVDTDFGNSGSLEVTV